MRAIYSTLPADGPEMAILKRVVLPYFNEVLGKERAHLPVQALSFAKALKNIYGMAGFTPGKCVAIIFTDLTGDLKEIRDLLTSIPANLEMQVFALGEIGAKRAARLQNLASRQLAFGVMATDKATEVVIDQIILDRLTGGNYLN